MTDSIRPTTPDYEPLDISSVCNAGLELYDRDLEVRSGGTWLYPRDRRPPIGLQRFHGLPFQIGPHSPSETRCFVALGCSEGPSTKSVVVVVNKRTEQVIFAHALLETHLWEGGPLGSVVARYVFHLADGSSIDVPIRERFEIGNLPLPWGQLPFLAVPDQQNKLADRYEGRWENTGFRQTEASQGTPRGYFLWAWRNPHPEVELRSIELFAGNLCLVVAAITLSHLKEPPFVRSTSRTVAVVLKKEERANQPFDLEIRVDRGVATYPYPLPDEPLDRPAAGFPGFGAPLNQKSSPAYSQIAANPSATVSVVQGGSTLVEARWGDLEAGGTGESDEARIEIVDPGKNWVHVKVIDDESGEPIPCRIAFHSPEGVPYPPHGHQSPLFSNMGTWHIDNGGDVRLGQITYAYIDGTCQGWLPRGTVMVDAARGYEYEPLRTRVTINPGQQSLTLRLKRWVDMNAARYFSGDTHVHFLSAQGAQFEAAGEDLNVVNLLLSQWGHLYTNTEDFTGRPQVSPDGRTIVFAGHENRQHILGHLTLLGMKTPVMPWCSDGPDEADLGGGLDITLSEWADACHAQGGTVVVPHIPTPNCEPAVLVATGRADAVEMLEQLEYEHLEYYRYLNGGYRLPLVGGTDRMDAGVPVGLYRTYVYIPPDQEFTYQNWLRALRTGHTFVSGGPIIWFSVEGQPIGSTLHVRGGGSVEVEAHARSILPIATLQIVQNGRVVAESSEASGARELIVRARLEIRGDSWLAARCGGLQYMPTRHFDTRRRGVMAHTSPIYVACGREYSVFDLATTEYLLTLVEGGLEYIRNLSPQHPPSLVTHHHGEGDHLGHLERPFREAQSILLQRLDRERPSAPGGQRTGVSE